MSVPNPAQHVTLTHRAVLLGRELQDFTDVCDITLMFKIGHYINTHTIADMILLS